MTQGLVETGSRERGWWRGGARTREILRSWPRTWRPGKSQLTINIDRNPTCENASECPSDLPQTFQMRVAREWPEFGVCFAPFEETAAWLISPQCRGPLKPDFRVLSAVEMVPEHGAGIRDPGSPGPCPQQWWNLGRAFRCARILSQVWNMKGWKRFLGHLVVEVSVLASLKAAFSTWGQGLEPGKLQHLPLPGGWPSHPPNEHAVPHLPHPNLLH